MTTAENISRAIRLRQIERELGLWTQAKDEYSERELARQGLARWLALPITYDNAPEPRWNAGAAARNDAILALRREVTRTMGGVADYSSREAA